MLIQLIVTLVIVGVLLYILDLILNALEMNNNVRLIVRALILLLAFLYCLNLFGFIGPVDMLRVR